MCQSLTPSWTAFDPATVSGRLLITKGEAAEQLGVSAARVRIPLGIPTPDHSSIPAVEFAHEPTRNRSASLHADGSVSPG
jgi:hypothetical protein